MGFDGMAWQLKLEELIAEANVYANTTAQEVVDAFAARHEGRNEDGLTHMRAAGEAASRWQLVQDDIQLHMNSRNRSLP